MPCIHRLNLQHKADIDSPVELPHPGSRPILTIARYQAPR